MTLPNTYFENFPIEFKQINPGDFPEFEVENNNEKIIIEPDSDGYINDAFQGHINLLHKNTVVVNAAVGQGKSTAIINTIKRYYENHPETLIFVASPFVSLVDQYCNDIHLKGNIPEDQIYNYRKIGRSLTDFRRKRIHVITANTLLGNPGEDSFINGKNKRRYLNSLLDHCERNRLKVVFIYDEIHDAIANFKEEYIFNLWKWRNVILKNYILSATYSEASKIVIEYLAELTSKKIQIVESKRIIFHNKQSTLHLHYSPAYSFKSDNPELLKIVERLITLEKQIDILSFSKKLAKQIIKDSDGVGKLLKEKFELNDCTSQLKNNQRPHDEIVTNRYDNSKCNIGTNFKTGVSIEKENHAFIIILPSTSTKRTSKRLSSPTTALRIPSRETRTTFKNQYGIFSDGINNIIQALARQRIKGEIHIILPNPGAFDYDSLNLASFNEDQKIAFKDFYEEVKNNSNNQENNIVNYIKFEDQDAILSSFYNEKLYANVANEIGYINSLDRTLLSPLRYPSYKLFKLNKGEKYLANKFEFFGSDLSAYVTYCAITNQFVNCRLTEFSSKPILNFEEGKFQVKFWRYYNLYFEDCNALKEHFNFNYFYQLVRAKFFNSFNLKLKNRNGDFTTISQYNKMFETQLLRFCGFQYYASNFSLFINNRDTRQDIIYSRGNYILDSIAASNSIDLNTSGYTSERMFKVKAYQNLNLIRNFIIQKIRNHNRGRRQFNYLPLTPLEDFFSQAQNNLIIQTINLLIEYDGLLKNDVFNFKRNFFNPDGTEKLEENKIKSFYRILLDDLFITEENYSSLTQNGNSFRVKQIIETKNLPNNKFIDILSIDSIIQFAENEYGSFENYQSVMNNLLDESEI